MLGNKAPLFQITDRARIIRPERQNQSPIGGGKSLPSGFCFTTGWSIRNMEHFVLPMTPPIDYDKS